MQLRKRENETIPEDQKATEAIQAYIKKKCDFSVPELQEALGLTYYVVRRILDRLIRKKTVAYVEGITYHYEVTRESVFELFKEAEDDDDDNDNEEDDDDDKDDDKDDDEVNIDDLRRALRETAMQHPMRMATGGKGSVTEKDDGKGDERKARRPPPDGVQSNSREAEMKKFFVAQYLERGMRVARTPNGVWVSLPMPLPDAIFYRMELTTSEGKCYLVDHGTSFSMFCERLSLRESDAESVVKHIADRYGVTFSDHELRVEVEEPRKAVYDMMRIFAVGEFLTRMDGDTISAYINRTAPKRTRAASRRKK